jgi:hypothetical protein
MTEAASQLHREYQRIKGNQKLLLVLFAFLDSGHFAEEADSLDKQARAAEEEANQEAAGGANGFGGGAGRAYGGSGGGASGDNNGGGFGSIGWA